MTTANLYAPPRTAVADVDSGPVATAPVRTWSAQGRIGRLRYIAHLVAGYIVLVAAAFLVGFVLAMAGFEAGAGAAGGIVGIGYFWFFVLKTIQRSHDMDWSGWTWLLALIPFVGLIWWFKGGSPRANRFGPPAPPNTTGVKILALALPVIMVIGLVVAIALPAYKDYTDRARAVQVK